MRAGSSKYIQGQQITNSNDKSPQRYLCMLYLKLSHLYQVLSEGHNTPGFETSEFYKENIVQ